MTNFILKKAALYVRDLLSYPENLIRIGRENYLRESHSTNYITVDSLGQSQVIGESRFYDSMTESEKYAKKIAVNIDLNFFGSDAIKNATDFINYNSSQKAAEIMRSLDVACYRVNGFNDLKQLTGQQYINMINMQFVMIASYSLDLSVLRIEEFQKEYLWDK